MTSLDPAVACEPGVVPEPPPRPVNLPQWLRLVRKNPIAVFDRDAFAADFRAKRVFFGNFVLVNEPSFIEHVLLENHRNYSKGRLTRDALEPALGKGLLTSEGDRWRRQRRMASPGFHKQRVAHMAGAMARLARRRVEGWRICSRNGQPLDIAREIPSLTMEIVGRTLFSMDMTDASDELARAMTTVVASFGTLNPLDILGAPAWVPRFRSRRARSALARLDRAIYGIIAERRGARKAPDDLLGLLLAARDGKTGADIGDTELRDEVATFFAAGHETTALALAWTLYLLSRHPTVEEKLHAEVDGVPGDGEAAVVDVESLPYTRMVVEESMRLFPPAFCIQRVPLEDDEVGGHCIPAGSFVTISPYVTHRNPRLWEDPLRFDPERFTPERTGERHAFAYLPFGGGPRQCIGNGFAMLEACVVLATIARAYRLRMVPGHCVEAQGWITLRPRYGLRMTLEPRTVS